MNDDTTRPSFRRCRECNIESPLTSEYFYRHSKSPEGFRIICKKCQRAKTLVYHEYNPNSGNQKTCRKCHTEYPATAHYFFRKAQGLQGLDSICKQCKGIRFGVHVTPPASSDEYKRCSRCLAEKLKSEFGKDPRIQVKDGLRSWCKVCCRASDRQMRIDNPERYREKDRRNWASRRERMLEYNRQYRIINAAEIRKRRQNPSAKSAERQRKYNKIWFSQNPERSRTYAAKRLARRKNLPDTLTRSEWQSAIDYFHGCCAVCGRQVKDLFNTHTLAMDHWIPLSSSECPGTIATNIIPLCHGQGGCNNSKNDKPAEQWLVERYGERKSKLIMERINTYFDTIKGI